MAEYPGPGRRVTISTSGGTDPLWRQASSLSAHLRPPSVLGPQNTFRLSTLASISVGVRQMGRISLRESSGS